MSIFNRDRETLDRSMLESNDCSTCEESDSYHGEDELVILEHSSVADYENFDYHKYDRSKLTMSDPEYITNPGNLI